jgi:hypothetical protein
MTRSAKKRATRQEGGRPVVQCRVHEDVYATLKKSARERKLTISQEAARCIGKTQILEREELDQEALMKLGAEEFLVRSGYTKVREADGTHLWAKGAAAVAKWTAINPDLEAAIERIVVRAMQKAKEQ